MCAAGDGAGQADGAVPELAHLGQERERVVLAGMTAGTAAHQHQAIHASLDGLARQRRRNDIGHHQPAIGVHPVQHPAWAAQGSGDDAGPVALDQRHLGVEAVVAAVHDHVQCPRHGRAILGMRGDLRKRLVQRLDIASVGRGIGADDARAEAGAHQFRAGNQEHRCGHHRQARSGEGRAQRCVRRGGVWNGGVHFFVVSFSRVVVARAAHALPSRHRFAGWLPWWPANWYGRRAARSARCGPPAAQ
ncbi:hypothetical protein D9M72_239330 [compost metagenome]